MGKKPSGTDPDDDQNMSQTGEGGGDVARLSLVFPNVQNLLRPIPPLAEIVDACIYVLDTSCLLAPFDLSRDSFTEFAKILRRLQEAGRIRVPEHVIREYANRRTKKSAEILGKLTQARDKIEQRQSQLDSVEIPVLQAAETFEQLRSSRKELSRAVDSYKAALDALVEEFRTWTRYDPVTRLYNEVVVIPNGVLAGAKPTPQEIQADYKQRCDKRIPPGYRDGGKPDGVGDVVIWHTILTIGTTEKRNVVFVTKERKEDWVICIDTDVVGARFELVDEFYRRTGREFALIDVAEWLRQNKAPDATVREMKRAELNDSLRARADAELRNEALAVTARMRQRCLEAMNSPDASGKLPRRVLHAIHSFHRFWDAFEQRFPGQIRAQAGRCRSVINTILRTQHAAYAGPVEYPTRLLAALVELTGMLLIRLNDMRGL